MLLHDSQYVQQTQRLLHDSQCVQEPAAIVVARAPGLQQQGTEQSGAVAAPHGCSAPCTAQCGSGLPTLHQLGQQLLTSLMLLYGPEIIYRLGRYMLVSFFEFPHEQTNKCVCHHDGLQSVHACMFVFTHTVRGASEFTSDESCIRHLCRNQLQ